MAKIDRVEEALQRPDEAAFIRNPLEVIGLNRLRVGQLSHDEEVLRAVVSSLVSARLRQLHPDVLRQRPEHPDNGGDPEKWKEVQAEITKQRTILTNASQDLFRQERFHEFVDDYTVPLTTDGSGEYVDVDPDLLVSQAREKKENVERFLKRQQRQFMGYIRDINRDDILTVRTCTPATIELLSVGDLESFEHAFRGISRGDSPEAVAVRALFRKELIVNENGEAQLAGGRESNNPHASEKRLYACLEVPEELDLGAMLSAFNLKTPGPDRMLTDQRTPSSGNPGTHHPFNFFCIREPEMVGLSRFMTPRLEPSATDMKLLLVTRYTDANSGLRYFEIEGEVRAVRQGKQGESGPSGKTTTGERTSSAEKTRADKTASVDKKKTTRNAGEKKAPRKKATRSKKSSENKEKKSKRSSKKKDSGE